MKTTLVLLASVMLVLGTMGVAFAATSQGVTASVEVPGVLSITADNMDFGPVLPGNNGTDTLDLTIDSNTGYDVNAKSNNVANPGYFQKYAGVDSTIADEKLEWSDGEATPAWTGYDPVAATIASGSAGAAIGHNIDHRLAIPGGAEAGDYTLPITVSVVASA